jgi:SHS2 domain-containing protein
VGVAVEGASPEEALARLVLAFAALLTGGETIEGAREERLIARGETRADVAVELLRELLYRFATERLVPAACEPVQVDPSAAEVSIGFGSYDPERHAEGLDLKAVTRHAARFEQVGAEWHAQVLFDI